jgi:hypothetical protein
MATSTTHLPASIAVEEYSVRAPREDREEFVEAPECRQRSARGAITGIVLGAGLWGAILLGCGVIKL